MSATKPRVVIPPVGREQFQPINPQQVEFVKAIKEGDQVFATGVAGTGKTYIPTSLAADMLISKSIRKFIISRPAVAAGEKLGYLPGDLSEKLAPWVVPIWDVLEERLGRANTQSLYEAGKIEVASFEHMRGRTLDDSFILLDEAQNTTIEQMKMFLTRIGRNSKVVVSGDLRQSDIRGMNGLEFALEINDLEDIAPHIHLTKVERSGVCAIWADAFERADYAAIA